MSHAKPLSAKQLAVIDDLFEGRMEEPEMLKNHNISRKLYDKWLADEDFNNHLDRRMVWEYRRCEFMLAHYARVAASNLVRLTDADPKQPEAARKACIDIITMRANLLAGTHLSGTPALPGDNPKLLSESPNLSPETTGKLLAVLAEEKNT
ncbi:MAG: hypothetical protein ACYSTT_01460 [Planctomycetota bacterium]|jgi:hypothetical protein